MLVTGGTRGIGLACARAFGAIGDNVAVLSRSTTTDEFPCFTCDVSDAAAVDDTFGKVEAEIGKVQVLVSNAGITRDTLLARMKDDDWQDVIDTNLTGAFHVARRAIAPMMKARWGRLDLRVVRRRLPRRPRPDELRRDQGRTHRLRPIDRPRVRHRAASPPTSSPPAPSTPT